MNDLFKMLLTASLLIILLVGCDDSKTEPQKQAAPTKDLSVVFIPKITGNAFFEAANAGAQAYAARNNFKVDYRGSSEADVTKQIEIVQKAIDEKVNAISISSLDATALDDVLKKALAAGIKVTTWDSDVSGDARLIMVSQGTPSQLGNMLVEMGAKSLIKRKKDPTTDKIKYAWHYSQASVTDQNSWRIAGEEYIKATYPNWVNVAPENYFSEQDPEKALAIGKAILEENPDIDLIICNDSTSLPGQAQALEEKGLTAEDVTITGFASPNAMKEFCKKEILYRWGLWDCQIQGALGCFLAYYLANGNNLNVGQMVDVPEIGLLEVMPNTVLSPTAKTAQNSGVVLLPNRTEFTIENMDDYDF